jgi:hypothetical protein
VVHVGASGRECVGKTAVVALAARCPRLPSSSALHPTRACYPRSENAELYAVHPYRLFTVVSGANLTAAKRAYAARRFPCNTGWCQDLMDAALLGNAADVQAQAIDRALAPPAVGYRFPCACAVDAVASVFARVRCHTCVRAAGTHGHDCVRRLYCTCLSPSLSFSLSLYAVATVVVAWS